MPSKRLERTLMRPLDALAAPGMYLVYKYNQFKRQQQENSRRKVTEKELQTLNHKIDKLLAKLDENDADGKTLSQEEECVVCLCAKATMQTFPCGHKVVCRKCFVKTIQVAVSQRCLPLKCVVCRSRVLKLKQSGEEELTSASGNRGSSSPGRQSSGSRLLARLFSSRSSQPTQPSHVSSSGSATSLGSTLGDAQPRTPSPCGDVPTRKIQDRLPTAASHQRQTQPVVATKLMQPWLIYPSMSSPKQQRAFSGGIPEETPLRNYAAPPSGGATKDMQKGHIQLRPRGPFSPVQRRPKHHCSPVTSSRIAELKHAHMLSPRVPRCSECIQKQQSTPPMRARTTVAD